VCRLRVRNQAKRLHNFGPRRGQMRFPEAGPQKIGPFLPVKQRSWAETQHCNSTQASGVAGE
jgi:hypothetical protein